jgi:hypothetical protein
MMGFNVTVSTTDVGGDLSPVLPTLDLPAGPAPGRSVRRWISSVLGRARWHDQAPVWNAPATSPRDELVTALAMEQIPLRLTMHGVLTAWREAERALAELTEGTPEWAAVNATLISLRASYLARFDKHLGR